MTADGFAEPFENKNIILKEISCYEKVCMFSLRLCS